MRDVNARALVVEVVLLLLVLAVAEMALRLYLHSPTATLFPRLFGSPLTTAKFLAYRRLDDQREPLDVLLMGRSQVGRLSAAELIQEVFKASGARLTVFNFGSPGHSVEYDRHLLQDVLVRIKQPRVIVYGLIPTNLIQEPGSMQPGTTDSPVFSAYTGTPAAVLQRTLLEHVDLILYREALQARLTGAGTGQMRYWEWAARKISPIGDMAPPIPREPPPFLNTWERKHLVPPMRHFDTLIARGALFENIAELARTCRALAIRLVLLASPVGPLYMQILPGGADDYREYRRRLQEAAAAAEVPLLDPSPDGIGSPEMFVDATHNSQAGITWMSQAISAYLIEHGLVGTRDAPAVTQVQ